MTRLSKLFPSLTFGGRNIWPKMLEVLGPVKAKLDKIASMGLREFKSTVANCNAGLVVAVLSPKGCGFLVIAKMNNIEVREASNLRNHKETKTRFFSWDTCPKDLDWFWGRTWTPTLFGFEGEQFRGETTLDQDIEKWLANVGVEIEEAKKKVMRQTRQKLENASNAGRLDLVMRCAEVFAEDKKPRVKRSWLDSLEERVKFSPNVVAILFIVAVVLWLVLVVKHFLF